MKQLQSKAIVLSRTDYGEADRIITVLTPEQGKLSLMARGARRVRSKLAGGIELFSVVDVSYIQGRGQIATLISARLVHYYSNIVKDIDRVQLGYELIKVLHRATEDQPEPEYFELLQTAFKALDTSTIGIDVIRAWFQSQLLRFSGQSPNLKTDTLGDKLLANGLYDFDFEAMTFRQGPEGQFSSDHIKLLRLIFSGNPPDILAHIQNLDNLLAACQPLIQTMLQTYIRI